MKALVYSQYSDIDYAIKIEARTKVKGNRKGQTAIVLDGNAWGKALSQQLILDKFFFRMLFWIIYLYKVYQKNYNFYVKFITK